MNFTKYFEDQRLLKVYGGANGGKVGVRIDGKSYMLKFPSYNKLDLNESYSNSSISEDMGCKILKTLGMETQNTLLGEIQTKGKTKVCVACEDFETQGFRLYHFSSIKNDDIDTASKGNNTELNEVLEAIEKQRFLPANEVSEYFWDLFIADSLIANQDRHNGNWGFLLNEELGVAKLSPIYDCGSSLSSSASDKKMEEIMNSKSEFDNRLYVMNRSAIKENHKRITYYPFLTSTTNKDCLAAIKNIVPKIDMDKINAIIENTPYLSTTAIQFQKKMIKARYERMLLPALERAKTLSKEESNKI